jgi:hypothetical protein
MKRRANINVLSGASSRWCIAWPCLWLVLLLSGYAARDRGWSDSGALLPGVKQWKRVKGQFTRRKSVSADMGPRTLLAIVVVV